MNEISTSNENNFYNHIQVITSSLAGFGKSTYIKRVIESQKNNIYVVFPIGGEIKRKFIMRRLKELNFNDKKNYGLHLDFSDTNQIEVLEDFLFSFLIQKEYY